MHPMRAAGIGLAKVAQQRYIPNTGEITKRLWKSLGPRWGKMSMLDKLIYLGLGGAMTGATNLVGGGSVDQAISSGLDAAKRLAQKPLQQQSIDSFRRMVEGSPLRNYKIPAEY